MSSALLAVLSTHLVKQWSPTSQDDGRYMKETLYLFHFHKILFIISTFLSFLFRLLLPFQASNEAIHKENTPHSHDLQRWVAGRNWFVWRGSQAKKVRGTTVVEGSVSKWIPRGGINYHKQWVSKGPPVILIRINVAMERRSGWMVGHTKRKTKVCVLHPMCC